MSDPIVESKQAEAAQAAAVAKEADQRAFEVTMQNTLVHALKEALVYPGDDRPALVARIPVICNDIREIKSNMKWQMWIVSISTPVLLTVLGYFAVQVLNEQVSIAKTQTSIQFLIAQENLKTQ